MLRSKICSEPMTLSAKDDTQCGSVYRVEDRFIGAVCHRLPTYFAKISLYSIISARERSCGTSIGGLCRSSGGVRSFDFVLRAMAAKAEPLLH